MDWTSPVPLSAEDKSGTTWHVRRAWPDRRPGCYLLEVSTPGQPGVRGARLRHGHFKLIPLDDPRLPALQVEAQQGELIAYRPFDRAVVRAEGRYIKIFRPGRADVARERCSQLNILLDAGRFTVPKILSYRSPDVIAFSAIPGPTLCEVASTADDAAFAGAWDKWSQAWVAQVSGPYGPTALSVLESLPLHSAELEAAKVWQMVNLWLRHNEEIPELMPLGEALRAAAEDVALDLLGAAADPLVWAHGGLHDKQIIATEGSSPLGLLDFDKTARAEAALDLASLDVYLELRLREGRMTAARYRMAHAQVLSTADELHVTPARFQAYSEARWLRMINMPLRGRLSLILAALAEKKAARQPGDREEQLRKAGGGWPALWGVAPDASGRRR